MGYPTQQPGMANNPLPLSAMDDDGTGTRLRRGLGITNNSNETDRLLFMERRMIENTVLMNYQSVAANRKWRKEYAAKNGGVQNISISLSTRDDSDEDNLIDESVPLPSVMPLNSNFFVWPEATINPMLIDIKREKKANIYKMQTISR